MADNDIDMCDDLELVSFIAKEVEYYCTLVNDCNTCSCRYDAADNIYKCLYSWKFFNYNISKLTYTR